MEESDFLKELANLRAGQFYNGKINGKLKVIHDLPEYKSTSKVLFLSLAEGKSIEALGLEENARKLSALRELLKVWTREAIFGHRLFHADLHPGNIFFDMKSDEADADTITLLDFGSIGRFTLEEAKALFKITLGLSSSLENLVLDGLDSVANWKDGVERSQVVDLVTTLARSDASVSKKLKELLDRGVELGILLPKQFLQFYRGQAFLENQISEIYQMELGNDAGFEKSQEEFTLLYRTVFKWDIIWDVCLSACAVNDNCTCFVDNTVLRRYIESFFSGNPAS